jgi:hypothetical protein
MSAKNSRRIKIGDLVEWRNAVGGKYYGIVVSRNGALCHVEWITPHAPLDYIYASDLTKLERP